MKHLLKIYYWIYLELLKDLYQLYWYSLMGWMQNIVYPIFKGNYWPLDFYFYLFLLFLFFNFLTPRLLDWYAFHLKYLYIFLFIYTLEAWTFHINVYLRKWQLQLVYHDPLFKLVFCRWSSENSKILWFLLTLCGF